MPTDEHGYDVESDFTKETFMDLLAAKLSNLDLSPIAFKLSKAHDGPRWSLQKTREAVKWYKNFLYLTMKHPTKALVPTRDIDEVWHYHILDTKKYIDDCEYLIGRYLHHFPYLGLRGKADEDRLEFLFAETLSLFREEFGNVPQISGSTTVCSNGCAKGSPVVGDVEFSIRPAI